MEDMRSTDPPEVPDSSGNIGGKRCHNNVTAPGTEQRIRKRLRGNQGDQMLMERDVDTNAAFIFDFFKNFVFVFVFVF